MKRILVVFMVTALSVFLAPTSYAHVLVSDTTGKTGAVLHIIPDDDPVAGEISSMYFDIQDTVVAERIQSVNVTIKDDKNSVDSINLKVDGSLATANYTFPLQGQYGMTFIVKTQSRSYTYEQVQRVSRGLTDGILTRPNRSWAEAALVGCGAALMVGSIMLWNHRKEVRRRSTL